MNQTSKAAKEEQNATFALLEYLCEIDYRRAFASASFTSLFDYLVRGLGYSELQASERVAAVRLMRKNDLARESIQTGKLTLTSAAQIQRFIQSERKVSDHTLSPKEKESLISTCSGKSKREVEKILFTSASQPTQNAMRERTRFVNENEIELKLTLSLEAQEKLNRAKELLHTETLAEMFEKALDALIGEKEKALGKKSEKETKIQAPPTELRETTKNPNSRYIPMGFKKVIYQRSGGVCEYQNESGERCESKAHLEVDHILPMAQGGKTGLCNLRFFCRNHNQYWGKSCGKSVGAGLRAKYETPSRIPQGRS